MLGTMWGKTLRDNLRGAAGWGIGMGLVFVFYAYAFSGMSKGANGPPSFSTMKPLLDALRALDGAPVAIDTLSGYLAFLGALISVVVSVWALLATSAMTRGEEERGVAEVAASLPLSRGRLLGEKWLGFSLALLLLCALMWLLLLLAFAVTIQPLDLPASIGYILDIGLQAWLWGAVGLALAQLFVTRVGAAGATAGVMLCCYFGNNILGGWPSLRGLTYLSPFHYFEVNRLLAVEYHFDPLTFAVAPLLALIMVGLVIFMFQRRDLGAVYPLRCAPQAAAAVKPLSWRGGLLGGVFAKTLRDLRWPALWWGLGMVGFASVETLTAQASFDVFKGNLTADSGMLGKLIGTMVTPQDWLAFGVFTPLLLALPIFAVTQVAGWAGEEEDGRMEATLATPTPRGAMLLARCGAVALVCLGLTLAVGVAITLEAAATGLDYDAGKTWAALIELLPLTLLTLAAGYALASWLPRPGLAVAIVAAFIVGSYLIEGFGLILGLSRWVRGLSVYYYYGSPAQQGLALAPPLAFLAVGLAMLAAAVVGFGRRDVAKG